MKKILIFSFSLLISHLTFAQYKEIGGGLGASIYKGDIAYEIHPANYRPAMNIFFRYNYNPAISMKYNFYLCWLSGKDKIYDYALNKARDYSFDNVVFETSAMFEYNFLDFRKTKPPVKFSPYLTGGLGLFYFWQSYEFPFQPCLPFGFGFKYKLNRNWNLGFEFGARATFTDQLDLRSSQIGKDAFRSGNPNTFDMYMYNGFSISYVIYEVNCPAHYDW